jgi:hypothetical protein
MSKYKTLCELDKKDIEKRIDEISKIIKNPNFICRKCARAANEKEFLCKPQKIKV